MTINFAFLLALASLIFSTGCARNTPFPKDANVSSYSIDVPFVVPRSELCGSTSLEMLSSYWQSKGSYTPKLSLEELDNRTLIPAKSGTLQIELVAAARANGLLVYPLEPNFDALFMELKANHPVIVLVNRGLSWYELWHYAPVTGYDAKTQTILMHFSEEPNEAVSIETFAAIWKRSGNWGVVLLPPDELPSSASPKKYLQSAYDLEKIGMVDEAIVAYKSALSRWPQDIPMLFALGNAYYSTNQLSSAEERYREILLIDKTHPLALNNLADLLCHTDRAEEALRVIDTAETTDTKILSIINATRQEIIKGCTLH
ncbi:PA2778 family cysteine peptidase [Sulfurimonas sp.]|uniref:PA2778 family cysteine peptidase n=1 Tax=Sulfurimonas sp. TaxID=2022749 RepID=UPI0025F5C1AF|nr:PA2778 family cysteine peptidase [Sulfurimonas sp.]MBW6488917.1 PA2778 family cysteine peptidase [Sulfurimonas sp.]